MKKTKTAAVETAQAVVVETTTQETETIEVSVENRVEFAKSVYIKYESALEDGLNTLDECESAIDELIEAFNVISGVKEANARKLLITSLCGDIAKRYAQIMKREVYESLHKEENTMLAAALKFNYPVITVRRKSSKATGEDSLVKGFTDKAINPINLQSVYKDASAEADWVEYLKALNLVLAVKNAKDLSLTIGNDYNISANALGYLNIKNVGELKAADLTNKRIQQLFQRVVNKMIGKTDESKIHSEDLAYLIKAESSIRRPGELAILNDSQYSVHILRVIHKILDGKGYSVKYKAAKAK